MRAGDADDNQRSDSAGPELPDLLWFVERVLVIANLYFVYKQQEAATFTVTALLEYIRSMRS